MNAKNIWIVCIAAATLFSCSKKDIEIPDAQAELLFGTWQLVGVWQSPVIQNVGEQQIAYDRKGNSSLKEKGKVIWSGRFSFGSSTQAHSLFGSKTYIKQENNISQWFRISNDTLYTDPYKANDLPSCVYRRIH